MTPQEQGKILAALWECQSAIGAALGCPSLPESVRGYLTGPWKLSAAVLAQHQGEDDIVRTWAKSGARVGLTGGTR
jgi:hypothetical protein